MTALARGGRALAVVLAAVALAACEKPASGPAPAAGDALVVLAGSELKDIEPLLPQVAKATGVALQFRYTGTLDAVERLQGGEAVDAAWLASGKYAQLTPGVKERVLASEKTMLTPVVLGLKESKARELGWLDNADLTWKDIADAAGRGRFTFAMTSPTASNSGFSALLGLAAALANKGDAIQVGDIDARRLTAFFSAQKLTAGSSGWLAEAYVREQDHIDGIVNYASTLARLNRDGTLNERLALIYPKDGIVTADYPFMLINGAKRTQFDRVVGYLRGADFQRAIMQQTLRRPVNPEVTVDAALQTKATLVELPFPSRLEVVDAILVAFENRLRLPADSTFVLDISGSMRGGRIDSLKRAMQVLAGGEQTLTGRFARFRDRETVVVLPFSSAPREPQTFELTADAAANRKIVDAIRGATDALEADGATAIFSATRLAYENALARRHRRNDQRFYSIVLMTDGENNQGITAADFDRWYRGLPESDRSIRVFPVLFGEGKPAELEGLARLTGGRVFDGMHGNLALVFKEIRGYQ